MAFQHTVRYVYTTNAGVIIDVNESIVGAQQGVDIDTQVLPDVTVGFDVNVVTAKVQTLLIWCDQPAVLMTNDANAPTDSIPIKQNVPVIWTLNSFWPIPFKAGSISQLFVTNNGPVPANLKIRMLSN